MPEADAIWRTARRLDTALRGQVLTDWDIRWARWATTDLRGSRTLEVIARGKHLLHRLDSGHTLHSHLRMEGSWRVLGRSSTSPGVLRRRDVRVLVGTDAHWALGLRLGMVDLIATTREDTVVGHLGPDPLGSWDAALAARNLAAQGNCSIGAALLDQRVLAGLGTIWTSETLFAERVSPWALVGELSSGQVDGVVRRAQRLLHAAIAARGHPTRYVYGRRGPCVRCDGPVRTGRVGAPPEDRQLYFCGRCQAR